MLRIKVPLCSIAMHESPLITPCSYGFMFCKRKFHVVLYLAFLLYDFDKKLTDLFGVMTVAGHIRQESLFLILRQELMHMAIPLPHCSL